MQRIFKLLLILIAVFLISFLSFHFYKANAINTLEVKKVQVNSKWALLYENTDIRYKLLKTIDTEIKGKGFIFDSLNKLLINPVAKRDFYKHECSLDFTKQEFDLNNGYLKYLIGQQNNNVIKEKAVSDLIAKLKFNDEKINLIIDDYNQYALNYNKYISTFPNFVFAKKNGFTKKKYFTIKYGEENKDPIVKSKELPEWAKDIDTL